MSRTRVSKFVLEDNSVTFEQLAISQGGAGQVISVDENNQLLLTDRFTQVEIEDIAAQLLLRGNHTNLSVSYSSSNNQLDITATGAVSSVNTKIGEVVLNTDDIDEGSNLYYTDARVDARIPTTISSFTNDSGYLTDHQDLSVYALRTELFSGSYNDLTDTPTIPTTISSFTNDSGYLTEHQDLSSYALTTQLFSGSYNDLTDVPELVVSYNDLTDTPTIPSIAGLASETYVNTAISSLVNGADEAFDTLKEIQDAMATDTELASAISNLVIPEDVSDLADSTNLFFSGSYNDLTNTPTIPTVPTDVSEFTNDSGYLTDDTLLTDYGFITDNSVYGNSSNISSSIINVSSLNNDAGYISSTHTPISTFSNDAGYISSVSIDDLTDVSISTPSLVDNQFLRWNGYNAWINETIKISNLENDIGYLTEHQDLSSYALTTQLFSGSYNDLTNKPIIPTIPTNVSSFTNNSGYITNADLPTNYMVTDSNNTVSGIIAPSTDNTYDLGTSSQQWKTIYGREIEATYADLAERYEADSSYDVGTVVVFGGDKEITTTTEKKDVSVAGIISIHPALKMNASAGTDETHPYVALRGRVPCKIIGPVRKGDLIVTSSTPGFAESVGKVDYGHAVFAKSLETNLDIGEKLIEVVVV